MQESKDRHSRMSRLGNKERHFEGLGPYLSHASSLRPEIFLSFYSSHKP